MKRFSMLVGVAVIAAAMYVAAAPGSQQATGPSAKQFAALKKQVATLNKTVKALKTDEKTAKTDAEQAVSFIAGCLISANAGAVGVNQFGTSTDGYLFGANTVTAGTPDTVNAVPRTALDIDASATPGAFLQAVDPTCITTAGSLKGLVRTHSGRLALRAEHGR